MEISQFSFYFFLTGVFTTGGLGAVFTVSPSS
jgi:hypothetical protein